MNVLNLVEVDFGAFLLEEKCRNCNSIVENDFLRKSNVQSLRDVQMKLDSVFLTYELSPYKAICLKCSDLIKQQIIDGCNHKEETISGIEVRVYSATVYGGLIQKLIRKIKYDQEKIIAQDFGLILYRTVTSFFKSLEIETSLTKANGEQLPIILPVPLHKRRHRKRGYNQAHEIAKALAKHLPVKPSIETNILERTTNTKPQFDLDFKERHTNVVGAFNCRKTLDPCKHYIIVDDVLTTGTTMKECCKILIESGARKVSALVLSRAEY